MTTKVLTGIYDAYVIDAPITTLSIAGSGAIEEGVSSTGISRYTLINAGGVFNANTSSGTYFGVYLKGGAVVTNSGVVRSFDTTAGGGVAVLDGGVVTNESGGQILGFSGVVVDGQAGTVENDGRIVGIYKYGVELASGGVVDNGSASATSALIEGGVAVRSALTVTLHNYGTVLGSGTAGVGVYLSQGGLASNGSAADANALIAGYTAALASTAGVATILNYGTVSAAGTSGVAVLLESGGTVTNGASKDLTATVRSNGDGIEATAEAATVANFGTIFGGYQGGGSYAGIYLKAGGSVTNGSNADTAARIGGLIAAAISAKSGTIANFGTMGGAQCLIGAAATYGGKITNGSAADTSAVIEGLFAAAGTNEPVTVVNFGSLVGVFSTNASSGDVGTVLLGDGGTLTNGSATDIGASITGQTAVFSTYTLVATVNNFGVIYGSTTGVNLSGGGRITNGSASDTTAEISGGLFGAAITTDAGTISNFGTIRGEEFAGGAAAALTAGGALINGGTTDHAALIDGYNGMFTFAGDEITNYGTIAGADGRFATGVNLAAGAALTNEAGALIEGYTGLLVAAMATAINFGTIRTSDEYAVTLESGARLDMEAGSVVEGAVVAGGGLVDAVSGTSSVGALQSSGVVAGAGTISLDGGVSYLDSGIKLTVAEIAVGGSSTLVNVETKVTVSGKWIQAAGDLAVASGDQITFKASSDSFSGTISGPGTVEFDTGADSLSNLTLSAGLTKLAGAATLSLSGAIDATGPVDLDGGVLVVAAGGATLSGGGLITLTTSGTNLIKGAASAAVLTNADTIKAAGQVGDGVMSLVNSGTIESDFSTALTINTGTRTVVNSGLIEAIGSGGLVVASAVANTGTLMSNAATLTLEGAVTGAGTVRVDGGEVICEGAMNQTVRFGSTGRLALSDSQAFTAAITGFSTTGTTSLDLEDIDFSGASASYSGTASSGVLTVTDGTHTAKIHLTGNYLASTWHLSNDGSGGTVVVDPTASAPSAAPPHALIAAQASFGAAPASQIAANPVHVRAATPLLAPTHA